MANFLDREKSPYLRQHAKNPVNWHQWSGQTLNQASKAEKPLFISIGYATCHWCHVMERESFSNKQVASVMNENFLSIKIDREERPDIDAYFMLAASLMGVQGGWPLSVFALPNGQPFFIGTYFPPTARAGLPSFSDVLFHIAKLWKEKYKDIVLHAEHVHQAILKSSFEEIDFSKSSSFPKGFELANNYRELFSEDKIYFDLHWQYFDRQFGGFHFQSTVKFPSLLHLCHLLKIYSRKSNQDIWQMLEKTLQSIRQGGIYDQLQGGLSRYSTDKHWDVPHFEKMLYDNALYLEVLVDFCRASFFKNHNSNLAATYAETAVEVDHFLDQQFLSKEGLYYSAIDAESQGEEGSYYLWDEEEIKKILGEDAALFFNFYRLTFHSTLKGKAVLRTNDKWNEMDLPTKKKIGGLLKKLLKERDKRLPPKKDTKLLLGWNALLLMAKCKLAFLQQSKFLNKSYFSLKTLDQRVLQIEKMTSTMEDLFFFEGLWYRRYVDDQRKHLAQLSDLAAYGCALISVYELTWQQDYLEKSNDIAKTILKLFYDQEKKIFSETQKNEQAQLVKWSNTYDGVEPSGHALVAKLLLLLGNYFKQSDYLEIVRNIFLRFEKQIATTSFSALLSVLHEDKRGFWSLEVVYSSEKKMIKEKNELQIILETAGFLNHPHLFSFKVEEREKNCYTLCRENCCFLPVEDLASLEKILKQHFLSEKS